MSNHFFLSRCSPKHHLIWLLLCSFFLCCMFTFFICKMSYRNSCTITKKHKVLLSTVNMYLSGHSSFSSWPAKQCAVNHPKCCSCVFITDAFLLSRMPTTKWKSLLPPSPPSPLVSSVRRATGRGVGGVGGGGWQFAVVGVRIGGKRRHLAALSTKKGAWEIWPC